MPFDVAEAAPVLELTRAKTATLLGYLERRRWLRRLRRGLYVVVPLGLEPSSSLVVDHWLLAQRLFAPCYIGGLSAGLYWGLVEHSPPESFVVTAQRVRHRHQWVQGHRFHLTVRGPESFFGTVEVSRGGGSVAVADATRTVIDLLDDPRIAGGIAVVADVVYEYLRSDLRNEERLVDYGERLGNRAVFKRLGYLIEQMGAYGPELVDACLERGSAGLARLDPATPDGRIVRRWRLRVNAEIEAR
jgi:predicted transcriptional regulator of viral defense system